MNRRTKMLLVIGVVATALALVASLSFGLKPAHGEDPALGPALQNSGVDVVNAGIDETSRRAFVVTHSEYGGSVNDAWAIAVTRRELGSQLYLGKIAIDDVVMTFVDQEGKIVNEVSFSIRPQEIPALPNVAAERKAQIDTFLEQQAVVKPGVSLQRTLLAPVGDQGPVLQVELGVADGLSRDRTIKWIISDMINELRDEVEKSLGAAVAFYRLTIIEAETDRPLVDYVVEPGAENRFAWQAEDVHVDFRIVPTEDPSEASVGS